MVTPMPASIAWTTIGERSPARPARPLLSPNRISQEPGPNGDRTGDGPAEPATEGGDDDRQTGGRSTDLERGAAQGPATMPPMMAADQTGEGGRPRRRRCPATAVAPPGNTHQGGRQVVAQDRGPKAASSRLLGSVAGRRFRRSLLVSILSMSWVDGR